MHDACRHGQYNFLKFVQKRENYIEWQLCGQKCHFDVRGCHLCQMQTEKWGYNLHCLTKIERKRLEILDFSYNIQIVGSEFGINNMKAWIHLALCQHSGWCSGVWDIFLANFGQLSKIKWTGYKTCTANLPVNYSISNAPLIYQQSRITHICIGPSKLICESHHPYCPTFY